MNKKLKILTYILIVLLLGGIVTVLVYSDKKTSVTSIEKTHVEIISPAINKILTPYEIEEIINKEFISGSNEINIGNIEKALNANPYIKKAEIYASVDGGIKAQIKLREPIARVYEKSGSSYYIDESGHPFPLKKGWTAHVMVITGEWNEPYAKRHNLMHLDSLKSKSLLDDAAYLTNRINKSLFHQSLIEQIHVNSENEFELIPIIGRAYILFGDTSHTDGKLKKLELFYREGLNYTGYKNYTKINLKFKNQIICNK